ncbi:MAG: YlbF family regulator [Lachnospiraceae bacterium]|nr:YlbF family regulator [Lachnospiraceae bacterium]
MEENKNEKTEELFMAADHLTDLLFKTQEYLDYLREKERVKGDVECINRIRRFRELTYEMQSIADDNRRNEKYRIEKECEELCTDKRVIDYMQAEVDFIRIYQEVIKRIINRIELD